jgi:hypothetical protein
MCKCMTDSILLYHMEAMLQSYSDIKLLLIFIVFYNTRIAVILLISLDKLMITHQSALGPRGGLWPVLLVSNP